MANQSPLSLSARAATLLHVLGAPLVFLHCVDYVVQKTPKSRSGRDAESADLFCGKGAIKDGFRALGFNSNGFDASSDETDDINSVAGFLRAIQIILKLKPGGCVTAGPPCGSFVFINLGTSGRRTWRPFGFTDRAYVSAANKLMARLCLLLLLATVRVCVFSVEQPASTIMLALPYVKWLADLLGSLLQWKECRFPMGAYGHSHRKPSVLFGSAPWLPALKTKLSDRDKMRIKKHTAKGKLAKTYYNRQGVKRVCGTKALKASQVYPKKFGRRVASLHMGWMAEKGNVDVMKSMLYSPRSKPIEDMQPLKGPYRWRHAALSELRDFLVCEMERGNFHPLFEGGLE